jgi:hypothetical protein
MSMLAIYHLFGILIIFSLSSACEFGSEDYPVIHDDVNDEKEAILEDSNELREFEKKVANRLQILKNYMKTREDLLKLEKKSIKNLVMN